MVTYRGLAERGAGNGGGLAEALIREVPAAPLDAHLYRLYGLCADGLPVALLDDDGRLAGIAEPQAVFAQIAVDAAAAPDDRAIPPAPSAREGGLAEIGTASCRERVCQYV